MTTFVGTEPLDADTYLSEYRGVWSLIVPECPYCGGRTLHGGGSDTEEAMLNKPSLGYRSTDCCGNQIHLINAGLATPEIIKPPKRRRKAAK